LILSDRWLARSRSPRFGVSALPGLSGAEQPFETLLSLGGGVLARDVDIRPAGEPNCECRLAEPE
jgi:hypothetical protein